MTSRLTAHVERLGQAARPVDDADWGSERQIDAENAFWLAVEGVLGAGSGEMRYLEFYAEKATTDERVDEALSVLDGTSGGLVRFEEGR